MGNNPLRSPRLLKIQQRRLEEKQPERKEKPEEALVRKSREEKGVGHKGEVPQQKEKLNFKIKNFNVKRHYEGVKRQPTEWKKILANHLSDKRLISRTYKDLL